MSILRLGARVFSGSTFLSLVILSIPLAFDLGGRECGLLFSLSLAVFYSILSTARLSVPSSERWKPLRIFLSVLELLQYPIIIPGLLLFSLSKFSDEDAVAAQQQQQIIINPTADPIKDRSLNNSGGGYYYNGVERADLVDKLTIGGWDTFLTFSTPMFQLAEGFCSLLVIQAGGQICRWLVNSKRSDTWMITLLVASGGIISSSVYFLWRISQFPGIESLDAALIGVAITCAVFLCAYGIGSGRGNHIESSLLFSYIVLCVYQIFTDYKPSTLPSSPPPLQKSEFPPFPPLIMSSYATLTKSLAAFLPPFFMEIRAFLISAYSVLTPSVIISLAYRLSVFYASTRIIPAVRQSGADLIPRSPTPQQNGGRVPSPTRGRSDSRRNSVAQMMGGEQRAAEKDGMARIAGVFTWYSQTILIAVYTHLLLQHFEVVGGNGLAAGWVTGVPVGGHVWRWINVGATMLLYWLELVLGEADGNESLTSHWKTD